MAIKYIQCPTLFLAGSGTIIGATSIVLTNLEDIYGNTLTMTDFGSAGYITLEPDTSNEEAATFTNITANSNGTFTLTGVKTGLAKSPYTETSGLIRQHSGGSKVIVTDNVEFWNTFANKANDETITGQWTFNTFPVTPDNADASTTVKGITKLTTAPVSATDPIAVGSNDDRYKATAGSQGVPNASNTFVTTDNVYTAEADQSQTTQDGTIEVGEADATTKKNSLAFSFIPAKTKIRGVKLYKIADTGSFTGTVTITLEADNAGSPSGTALATQTITNATWLTLSVGEFETLFTAEYSMTVGSTYWIVVKPSTSDNSNHINLGTNTAGGYASGSTKYKNTTDGWVSVATIDLYFKTLQGIKSQVIESDSLGKLPLTFQNYTNKVSNSVVTYDVSTASGTQVIAHGLGVIPNKVTIKGVYSSGDSSLATSLGAFDGTHNSCVYTIQKTSSSEATSVGSSDTIAIYLLVSTGGADRVTGIISVDSTNITITWTKVGSTIGTANLLWEAQY